MLRAFVAVVVLAVVAPAYALVQRTFVASTGNDTNPCSLTKPCRGFVTAVPKTAIDGEVIVLDSAGYGAVTITKSITIAAPPGVYAGITVFAGDGITIDAPNVNVALRGLAIDGQGLLGGFNGIVFKTGASLAIEDCTISNMAFTAIHASAPNSKVTVKNSVMWRNGEGFRATDSVIASLDTVHIYNNRDYGAIATNGARLAVSDSVIANNDLTGIAASADPGTFTTVSVSRSLVMGSPTAFSVVALGGGLASIVSDANRLMFISGTLFKFSGLFFGTELIYSVGNNTVGYYGTATMGGSLTPLGQM